MKGSFDRIFSFLIGHRKHIIYGFYGTYFFIALLLFVGSISIASRDSNSLFFYRFGLTLGKGSIIVFVVTLIPGIATRFGVKHKVFSLIRTFRRYLGICMYALVLAHSWFVSVFPRLLSWPKTGTYLVFELFGIVASILIFLLFITSNDWSISKLRIWWYRLHKLVYITMWLILLHVGLQRVSAWSVLMALTVTAMMTSFVVEYIRKKNTSTPTSSVS